MIQYDTYYKSEAATRTCIQCSKKYHEWAAMQSLEPFAKCYECSLPKKTKGKRNDQAQGHASQGW